MSTTLLQISLNFSASSAPRDVFCKKPRSCYPLTRPKIVSLHQNRFNSSWGFHGGRDGIWVEDERLKTKMKKRGVLVKGLDLNGGADAAGTGTGTSGGAGGGGGEGGGGGGGGDTGVNGKLVGSVALAAGLTYLSLTGQIGLVFDGVVWFFSNIIWITIVTLVVLIGGWQIFVWWNTRDLVGGLCPTCGKEFVIFENSWKGIQKRCPICAEPFEVVDKKFVLKPVEFSNQPPSEEILKDLPPLKKGGISTGGFVDIEAEIIDAE